jgi:hypothetical protein
VVLIVTLNFTVLVKVTVGTGNSQLIPNVFGSTGPVAELTDVQVKVTFGGLVTPGFGEKVTEPGTEPPGDIV